ncbi:hypothetical protein GCM10027082_11380 [Comamonas humi]
MARAAAARQNPATAPPWGGLPPGISTTMKRWIPAALAALAFANSPAALATVAYRFASPLYNSLTDFVAPCSGGACANLAADTGVTGYFITAAPLPPNLTLAQQFSPSVQDWVFSNGSFTLTRDTPGVRLLNFRVATDAQGRITDTRILFSRWQDGAAGPHTEGDRVDYIGAAVTQDGLSNTAVVNASCREVAMAQTGVADSCNGFSLPDSSARASYAAGGTWTLEAPRANIDSVSTPEGHAGSTPLRFTVTLSEASDTPVRLRWRTVNGTAQAGQDYTAASGMLSWATGNNEAQHIDIDVLGDTTAEPDENFSVELYGFEGIAGGESTSGTGTIANDDGAVPPPGPVRPVPALGAWGLSLLGALLGLAALRRGRRSGARP